MKALSERRRVQLLAAAVTVGVTVIGVGLQREFPFGVVSLSDPPPGVVLEGFSAAEPFGRWTDGERARLRFAQPLPRRFQLKFRGHAFVGNPDKSVTVRVGGQTASRLALTGEDAEYSLALESPWLASDIEFAIHSPTSPRRLGLGEDGRLLGVAFSRIEILR